MKTVYLLRHAKSSWDDPSISDHQRPLARRGIKDAPRMGAHMFAKGFVPDRVLCSTARRALQTWELVSEALGHPPAVEVRDDLYDASPGILLSAIQALPEEAGSALLIGHNPAMENLALALAGSGDGDSLTAMEMKYPTGALAVLDFQVTTWREIGKGDGHLRAFIRPKSLT